MNNVKCKTENMAVRVYCLVWGCPGLVILIISLFVSLKVGNDFGQDNFAKFVTFVISSGLLGTVYYLFQSVLAEVSLRLQNPDVMRDIEQDSIRNFKFQPDTGNIVIDEPDKGDYHFHFE